MKYILAILICGSAACTVEQEPTPVNDAGTQHDEPAQHKYDTNYPPKDNEPGGGCISVITVNGKTRYLPCVPSEPHGPIYEMKGMASDVKTQDPIHN
jgi:hypothetical protein